jgi:UPF0755 protein
MLIAVIVIALVALAIGLFYYHKIAIKAAVPNALEDPFVLIPNNASYEEVTDILRNRNMLGDEALFHQLAQRMSYERDPMRSGRFEVKPGWSMIELIRHLRSGKQAPVDVVLTTERMPENVAAKVARFIEPDSVSLFNAFKDPALLQKMGYTEETLMSLFIPNTYEFFWNTSPEAFLERMQKEHDRFWSNGRLEKAKALGMTPAEVYTLASIVEKETLQDAEK